MDKIYASILSQYADKPQGKSDLVHVPAFVQLPSVIKSPRYETQISVVNADTLDTALVYTAAGKKTLLLNMANPDTPGGAPSLVGAQEEDLFRRTNLHKYLYYRLYPLHKRLILSRGVEVVRAGLRAGYTPLPTPAYVDIISGSAPRNRTTGTRLAPADAHALATKIATLFSTAAAGGYTHLVLSAWGCGGFGCPPEHVSLLFKQVCDAYAGVFEVITFAIWDENYPKSNYAVFKKTFGLL